jgi:hypothetical protein
MSFTPILSERAQLELLEAWKWYEDKQTGLGDKFKKELYGKLSK